MRERYYVYILRSEKDPTKSYVGFTRNIEKRLDQHNSGLGTYTKRYAPWRLQTYMVFSEIKKATAFEKYLKSGSGKAFVNNHL